MRDTASAETASADTADTVFAFGPFQLLPRRRLLLKHGEPLGLGSRAMALLHALLENAGELLSRQALEARVWPTTVVEETSLRVHISALRRALRDGQDGARYITTVPGRGYCFVAPVSRAVEARPEAAALPAWTNLADVPFGLVLQLLQGQQVLLADPPRFIRSASLVPMPDFRIAPDLGSRTGGIQMSTVASIEQTAPAHTIGRSRTSGRPA